MFEPKNISEFQDALTTKIIELKRMIEKFVLIDNEERLAEYQERVERIMPETKFANCGNLNSPHQAENAQDHNLKTVQ